MNKKIFFLAFAAVVLVAGGLAYYFTPFQDKQILHEPDARAIAEKTCIKGGEALGPGIHNPNSKTWWFDANLNVVKYGCNPACVVSEETKTAEINWRCTGLAVPVSNFKECEAAGNPVMESYPRRCAAGGQTFTEEISPEPPIVGGDEDEHGCKASAGYSWCEAKQKCLRMWEEPCAAPKETACTAEQRQGDVCPTLYAPVCGTVQIQCIKAPCYPITQTFSNACVACHNSLVSSYTLGSCANEGKTACPGTCPQYAKAAPDWCKDGTIIPGTKDGCGCIGHPTCKTKR